MEEDNFIWGGTKEIADRPRGRNCQGHGEGEGAGGGCAPSHAKQLLIKSKATSYINSIFLLNQLAACYFCNTRGMHNQH